MTDAYDSVPAAGGAARSLILAPMRGITVRAFRETFAEQIREAGFSFAVAPFIPANPGFRASDRLFSDLQPFPSGSVPNQQGSVPRQLGSVPKQLPRQQGPVPKIIPQIIGKDSVSLREMLRALKDRGFTRADLNAGCPFPMIRRRGRGSGLLRNPDLLCRMLEAGCDEMGPGAFSLKTRLGETSPDELLAITVRINVFPLAALTVHARTAAQMYAGEPDVAAFRRVAEASANPVIYNGDAGLAGNPEIDAIPNVSGVMVGRAFVRSLGARSDSAALAGAYVERLCGEMHGDVPVLGRMKELLSYWKDASPKWLRLWPSVKICRTVRELKKTLGMG